MKRRVIKAISCVTLLSIATLCALVTYVAASTARTVESMTSHNFVTDAGVEDLSTLPPEQLAQLYIGAATAVHEVQKSSQETTASLVNLAYGLVGVVFLLAGALIVAVLTWPPNNALERPRGGSN